MVHTATNTTTILRKKLHNNQIKKEKVDKQSLTT